MLKRLARAASAWLARGYWLVAAPPEQLPKPTEHERMETLRRRLEGFAQRERPIMAHWTRRPN